MPRPRKSLLCGLISSFFDLLFSPSSSSSPSSFFFSFFFFFFGPAGDERVDGRVAHHVAVAGLAVHVAVRKAVAEAAEHGRG